MVLYSTFDLWNKVYKSSLACNYSNKVNSISGETLISYKRKIKPNKKFRKTVNFQKNSRITLVGLLN